MEGAIEDVRPLLDQPDHPPDVVATERGELDTIEEIDPSRDRAQTGEHVGHVVFPAPLGPTMATRDRRQIEGEAIEHPGPAGVVRHTQAPNPYRMRGWLDEGGDQWVGNGWRGIEHGEHASRGRPHPLEGLRGAGQPDYQLEGSQRRQHDHRQ